MSYYIQNSPDRLPPIDEEPIVYEMDDFEVHAITDTSQPILPAYTTAIEFNASNMEVKIASLMGSNGVVRTFNAAGLPTGERVETDSPVAAFPPGKSGYISMGELTPADFPRGILQIENDQVLDSLNRPLDVAYCDLDLDGTEDLIIAEYGNFTGRLSQWQDSVPITLSPSPGAIKLKVADLDQDGNDDLIVLFAQGNERIEVWYARPGGGQRKLLYRFPPSYGSSDIEIVDFDNDGDLDLLHTCGDNYDYQPIPKAYHGLRLMENDGSQHFEEAWFYHLDGAYGAEAHDFDGDGDIDLAAIAYFVPPAKRAFRSFVYLEQTAPLEFKSESFAKSKDQFYICMTKGDIDDDGDMDLLLGNFSGYLPDSGPPAGRRGRLGKVVYLVLENKD